MRGRPVDVHLRRGWKAKLHVLGCLLSTDVAASGACKATGTRIRSMVHDEQASAAYGVWGQSKHGQQTQPSAAGGLPSQRLCHAAGRLPLA